MIKPDSRLVVHGYLNLPSGELPAEAAQVVVQVEDVSRADAPSRVIGEQRQSDVPLSWRKRLPFQVYIPAGGLDKRSTYSVRAHVDFNGSGQVEHGDLITMRAHPVLTRGYSEQVEIEVYLV